MSVREEFAARLNGHRDESVPEEPPPEPFPTDVLPGPWRSYVEAGSAALPCPPELIAVPMIAMLGAIVGNRAVIRLKSTWTETTSLFTVVVAPSGSLKTPAFKMARWPMNKLQEDEKERHDARMLLWEEDHARWEGEKKAFRGPEPQRPRMRDYFTKDVTMEALGVMLQNTPGVVIDEDELVAWVQRMNQYRKGGDRQQYMSIHSGEPIKVNRKSTEGSLYVPHPVVGVCGGIQPEVVESLRGDVQGDDGFVYRYLPTIPKVGPKQWNDAQVDRDVYAGMAELWRATDRMDDGCEYALSQGALALFARWSDHNSTEAWRLGGALRGFYVKLEAHVARFALILHIAQQNGRMEVDAETMHQAIRLGEWFRGEIHRFIPMMGLGSGAGSTDIGLWSRIRKYLRQALDEDLTQQFAEFAEYTESLNVENAKSDPGWISQKALQDKLRVPITQLLQQLDTQYDLGEVEKRVVPTGARPRTDWRLAQVSKSEFSDSALCEFSDSANWTGYIPWEDES